MQIMLYTVYMYGFGMFMVAMPVFTAVLYHSVHLPVPEYQQVHIPLTVDTETCAHPPPARCHWGRRGWRANAKAKADSRRT